MLLSDLPTPQVLIDHTRAMNNIARVQALASGAGVRLRPHAKTHKSPVVARWQIDAGAVGIACAKVGEAEVFVDAGITDIRLPYPVNPINAPRLVALMDRAAISIIVDHPEVARGWSDAMRRAGPDARRADQGRRRLSSLRDRSRRRSRSASSRRVAALPGFRLRGLLSHAGHAYHAASEEELRAIARAGGGDARGPARARGGGGHRARRDLGRARRRRCASARGQPGVTELRPGNYVYFDRTQVALGAASLDDCALTVLATVVVEASRDGSSSTAAARR